jgi:hypothetical protein
MDWGAISAVAEILAAVGVIVSLLYLAAQIRQNTRQLDEVGRSQRLESLNEVANRFTHWRELITANGDVASIWRRGQADFRSLDEDERVRFENLAIEMFWCFGMLFFYREESALGDLPEDVTQSNLHLLADSPGVRVWWATSPHRTQYPEAMIRFVDELYSKRDASSEAQ